MSKPKFSFKQIALALVIGIMTGVLFDFFIPDYRYYAYGGEVSKIQWDNSKTAGLIGREKQFPLTSIIIGLCITVAVIVINPLKNKTSNE